MPQIKNIEFLRILGCIIIVVFHLFERLKGFDLDLFHNLRLMSCNGQKAVDLFFILSGFFFIWTYKSDMSISEFIKKKIIRFNPVLISMILLCLILSITPYMKFTGFDNVFNILMLNGTGLVLKSGNIGQFWYVSAMFWVLLALFYSLKYFDKKKLDFIVVLAVFFCYSFLIHAKGGKINSYTQTFYYVFNVGMLRAIGGIGIGYLIGNWYKNNTESIKNYVFSKIQKISLTIIEAACLSFIIVNTMLHNIKYKNDMIFIVSFALIIICFIIKGGYISKLCDTNFWGKYSKYTYSIYMFHVTLFNFIKTFYIKTNSQFLIEHPFLNIILALILSIIGGILVYHFIEKPSTDYLKKKFLCKNIEIEKDYETK